MEWIKCSDKLPYKDNNSSIYCLVVVRPYNEYHKCWNLEDGDDHYTTAIGGRITHWMPLPLPPKE